MLVAVVVNLIGVLIFLFVFWRKHKEDYISEQIFPTLFLTLLGLGIFQLISYYLLSGWWFWFAILGISLGFGFGVYRYKLRFYESLDALVASLLPWFALYYLKDSVVSRNWFSFSAFIFIILLITLYLFLNMQYKKFRWYKSGRVGFAGLVTLGFAFLIRGLTGIWAPSILSFVGLFDIIASFIISVIAFGMVYNLARSKI
ncbi:hypothetical protein ACFL0F_01930 [Patescibacteria group bacterium]